MALLLICVVVSVIGNLWVVGKIWPVSKVYSFIVFVFFPASIFFMFTHWGDDHDIKVPFIITLVAAIIAVYQMDKLDAEYADEDDEEVSWLYDGRYDVANLAGGAQVGQPQHRTMRLSKADLVSV